MLFLSPVLGAPELTVPSKWVLNHGTAMMLNCNCVVGELPYESKVSGRTEYLPIGISLLSDPGKPESKPY